jgi:enoyl-CoA hydratase/carnithine racemase
MPLAQEALQLDFGGALGAGVARLTLRRPAKFNAMTRAMWRALADRMGELRERPGLRVLIVAGEGGHFCAGGDIAEYPHFRFDAQRLRDFHENEVWAGLSALLALDCPVIAQIDGHCMGAGVEIASCCDIRVATAAARFGAPIARLGFPMAPREAELVAREAGLATAREMLLQAAVLDADTLCTRGFLHAVLPDAAALDKDVQQRARRIGELSPEAARLNKQTLRALSQGQGADALVARAYDYAAHAEHREGIAAFLDKRLPVF